MKSVEQEKVIEKARMVRSLPIALCLTSVTGFPSLRYNVRAFSRLPCIIARTSSTTNIGGIPCPRFFQRILTRKNNNFPDAFYLFVAASPCLKYDVPAPLACTLSPPTGVA